MIRIYQLNKKTKISGYDIIFEEDPFKDGFSKYSPKLEGQWAIAIVGPKVTEVRQLLDRGNIPEWLNIDIYVDKDIAGRLSIEYPALEYENDSPWKRYMKLIENYEVLMDKRSMHEIYARNGPNIENLEKALDILRIYPEITIKEVDRHFPPVIQIYPKMVLMEFLKGEPVRGWAMLFKMESTISLEIAYFSMRKTTRKLMKEKSEYLLNREVTERSIKDVDAFTLAYAYYLFLESTNPNQLIPILTQIERRYNDSILGRTPDTECSEYDLSGE